MAEISIREDLAWAAGFFDGEGHVRLKRGNGRSGKARELQVAQKTRPCLERLKRIFETGTIGGPYHTKNPVYFWYVCRTIEVDRILNLIWPFMCEIKRQQALGAGFTFGQCASPKVGRPPVNPIIPACHPDRQHVAHGLCAPCYHANRYRQINGK